METICRCFKYLALPIVILALVVTSCTFSSIRPSTALDGWMKGCSKPKVLATTAIVGDMIRCVGGDDVSIIVLMPPPIDPHSYQIVRGDAELFDQSDIVFSSGLSLEHSASMQSRLSLHPNTIYLGDFINKRIPSQIIRIDGQIDPHIWMDLSLWSIGIEEVVRQLELLDPEHASKYKERGLEMMELFEAKDKEIALKLMSIPDSKRYVVTSHDAFNYFGRRYLATSKERGAKQWSMRVKAIQGLAPDEQISPLEIIDTVEFIQQTGVNIIFPEANLSQDSLWKVIDACRRKGLEVELSRETLFGDTLGDGSFFDMMDHNVGVLVESLGKVTSDQDQKKGSAA